MVEKLVCLGFVAIVGVAIMFQMGNDRRLPNDESVADDLKVDDIFSKEAGLKYAGESQFPICPELKVLSNSNLHEEHLKGTDTKPHGWLCTFDCPPEKIIQFYRFHYKELKTHENKTTDGNGEVEVELILSVNVRGQNGTWLLMFTFHPGMVEIMELPLHGDHANPF